MQTIAVVEDHEPFRKCIVNDLQKLGYHVVFEAANGLEGIKKIAALKILPDFILIDINMPEMDGTAFANFIDGKYPSIKKMAISSYIFKRLIEDMFDGGCLGFIDKANTKDLATALATINKKNFILITPKYQIYINIL